MTSFSPPTPSPHAIGDPAYTARMEKSQSEILRRFADEIALWIFCRRATCYRAQECNGDARACIARYAPLVPEDACAAVKAMFANGETPTQENISELLDTLIPNVFADDDEYAFEMLAQWRARATQACEPA